MTEPDTLAAPPSGEPATAAAVLPEPEAARPAAGLPGQLPHTVPGATPGTVPRKRFRPRIDYELVACGLHGHEIVGRAAAMVREQDAVVVREYDDVRWHRCLRCDAWVVLEPPVGSAAAEPHPPAVESIEIPIRGRRLRDHYVLRLIVLDRILHALLFGGLAIAIFAFAQHRDNLHRVYERILSVLNGSNGSWLVHELNKVFSLKTSTLYELGLAAAAYAAVLIIECVGLWGAKRWAEYLTLLEVAAFIPYEVYQMTSSVTVFKVGTLVVNVAIVLYLLLVHRLFGARGGIRAARLVYGEEG